jgi:hypothetical protein
MNFAFGTLLDGPIGAFIMEAPCQRLADSSEPLSSYSLGRGRRAATSVCHFASGSLRVDGPTDGMGFTVREFIYLAIGLVGYAACFVSALLLTVFLVRTVRRAVTSQ